jgi:histidyl-tRNA synthetase
MKTLVQSLKGTRDFYPEDMALRTWLYDKIRKVSESFGYQEYEGPFLESIELYAAKSGEELVKEQSFVFPDRGGDLITLRPELTPTLARMVAQRQKQLIYPLRWWSFGPFWRYERPQKGRSREFFQWNIDLIGVDTPEADAELIAIAVRFFQEVGLSPSQAQILVNNRRLMDAEFEKFGIPTDQRPEVLRLIDRRDKMKPDEWKSYAQEAGLDLRQFEALKGMLANDELWKQSVGMKRLFLALEALGVSSYVRYAPHIVRGLDYYTSTVFEAWDVEGEFRAMFGGGRYDNLVEAVGGDPLPATGFALGDVVITLILKKYGLIPEGLGDSPAPVLVTVFDESKLTASIALADELRMRGLNVSCYPEPARLGKQFKYADRIGALVAVVLGPDELATDQASIKNLRDGTQTTCTRNELAETVIGVLASLRA